MLWALAQSGPHTASNVGFSSLGPNVPSWLVAADSRHALCHFPKPNNAFVCAFFWPNRRQRRVTKKMAMDVTVGPSIGRRRPQQETQRHLAPGNYMGQDTECPWNIHLHILATNLLERKSSVVTDTRKGQRRATCMETQQQTCWHRHARHQHILLRI